MNTPINIKIAEILFKKHGILLSDISDVIMWLYEKHGIWLNVEYMDEVLLFGSSVCTIKTNTIEIEEWKFNSPTEAYEAAIEYVLTKLIKDE